MQTKEIAHELADRCEAIVYAPSEPGMWRAELTDDLNTLLGYASYQLGTSGDDCDIHFAQAVLRVTERVAESEGLRKV